MFVTLLPIVTLPKLVQPENSSFPMLVTPSGMLKLVRLLQPLNASSPMRVTLLGIVTLVRLVHIQNAISPILVTGRPLVVLGMVTAPPGPVYLVMVIAPLLVVYLNWAGTAAGSVNSNSSH